MLSALECYRHAAHCEELVRKAETDDNRALLRGLVDQWRWLALSAEAHAVMITRAHSPPPVTGV